MEKNNSIYLRPPCIKTYFGKSLVYYLFINVKWDDLNLSVGLFPIRSLRSARSNSNEPYIRHTLVRLSSATFPSTSKWDDLNSSMDLIALWSLRFAKTSKSQALAAHPVWLAIAFNRDVASGYLSLVSWKHWRKYGAQIYKSGCGVKFHHFFKMSGLKRHKVLSFNSTLESTKYLDKF